MAEPVAARNLPDSVCGCAVRKDPGGRPGQKHAIHLAIGVTLEGTKEVLGTGTTGTEGSKFRLRVLTNLQNRSVKDLFIACVDGLKVPRCD
jgi:transposase-like protein